VAGPNVQWMMILGRQPTDGHRGVSRGGTQYARSYLDEDTGEIHAEAPCGVRPWYAYGRFRVQEGRLELKEIRVFSSPERTTLVKNDPAWPPFGSINSWAPADDLTAEALRSIPMRFLRTIAIASVEKYGEGPLSETESKSMSKRPGRAGRSDEFYARWAARYVNKRDSRAPIADLAREHGLRREQVRDVIQLARDRGLLTAGRDGTLTARAKSILEAADGDRPK
jgi:transposase-like protein